MVSPFLPPAPTPPVNNHSSSHAIAASRDRNAGLLNLLKFSGGGQTSQGPPSHAEPQQQHDTSPGLHHQIPGPSSSYISHQTQVGPPSSQQETPHEHEEPHNFSTSRHPPLLAPAPSSADPSGLLAALMRGMRDTEDDSQDQHPVSHAQAAPPSFDHSSPPSNTRAYLLNLLNQPKPSQDDQQYRAENQSNNLTPQSGELSDPARAIAPVGMNYGQVAEMSAYEPEPRGEVQRIPSYHSYNSHESHGPAANAAYPPSNRGSGMEWPGYNQSPELQQSGQGPYGHPHTDFQSAPAPYQILKKSLPAESPAGSQGRPEDYSQIHDSPGLAQEHASRKTDYAPSADDTLVERPPGSAESYPNTAVPDNVKESSLDEVSHDVLESTSRESPAERLAEDAKVKAEIAKDFAESMDASAKRSPDFSSKYPNRDENSDSQDQYGDLEEEDARNVTDKLQAVADSWDSADAEDVFVADDPSPPPITVFNFPMQPWISIAVSAPEEEERPEFREGAIMDIARLKKDFDQIDRNLYTASQHCMAYGMSKAGGMHVIRQDDGKDVKVFSNTKDRIFNISMSVTPQDHAGLHREAIMGTGVSGTVYWVQILEGEKDHIDDAHPEQHGFALPPLSSQDGDTSGGVLKTRARVSSCHPEFFAVGRGKSITIVWPHFVMQEKLFKAGNDRVVDAEKLAKHCSLKINTGKAGKDFTFSQDDSVIVSLDKSGRVKFWDVRDLTAASEDSDPNNPVPAHTSLEIKDPIMTLASTPEGEKAWPTSVLLLDKIKPYQKRCALRYMIVGMKQNHTLQLWDLALGKPVQEFNLPHSKESDAVCSVAYNPASGMIVIGHPTRNSIYMAHLSAPRYTFKNISQAEYILRLGAKDITIPSPESTAVISGMREYSFANKGILRSLDMLSNPAMPQDGEEPTLFELYTMHSKGVACVLVRQAELGWSKDNKVVNGIDAVKTGVITVTPLKPLGPQPVDDVFQNNNKQAARPGKDTVTPVILQQDESLRKGTEPASPVKIQTRKDAETAATTPATPSAAPEKAEKKGRKGKKAAAAAAQAAADAQANGSTPSNGGKGNAAAAKGGDSGRGSAGSQRAAGPSISQEAIESTIKSMEGRLHTSISGVVDSAFSGLSKTVLAREADFDSRQLKLLDVVSDVLNQNVQGVLGDIISKQFSGSVIPSIAEATSRAAADQVGTKAAQIVQKELNKALPTIGEKVLLNDALVDALCDRIGASVAARVQDEVMHNLTTNLIPTITNVTIQTSHRVAGEVQQQYQEELDRLDANRRADANKIDQLFALVTRLSDTVSTMAAAQSQFQGEFLKLQQQSAADREHARQGPVASVSATESPYQVHQAVEAPQHHHHPQQQQHHHQHHPQQQQHHQQHQLPQVPHDSPGGQGVSSAEEELGRQINLINQSVRERRMEEAIIRWLQSGHEDEIFSRYWSNLSPVYLRDLPPLVLLSVATTVSQHLETALARQKTAWLEMSVHCLLNNVPTFDQQVREVTPNIMKLVISRSETMLMRVSAKDTLDPLLKNLSQLISTAKRILEATTNGSPY